MSDLGIVERVTPMDPQFQSACGYHIKEFTGSLLQLLRGCGVVTQSWAGKIQRTFLGKNNRVNRRNWAACPTEKNQIASRAKHVKVLVEGAPANAIINHVNATITCETQSLSFKILFRINDDLISACLAGQLGLRFVANCADYLGPQVFGHLHQ